MRSTMTSLGLLLGALALAALCCACDQRLELFAPLDQGGPALTLEMGPDGSALAPDLGAPHDMAPDLAPSPDQRPEVDLRAPLDLGPAPSFERVDLDAGAHHTCLILDGRLWCWGEGRHGQLGRGADAEAPGHDPAAIEGQRWQQVACGRSHTCALHDDGGVWCWGDNRQGQIGRGPGEVAEAPAQVALFEDVIEVSTQTSHTCALVQSGRVWCWGRNREGELGQRTNEFNGPAQIETPVRVEGLAQIVEVAAGDGFTCALRDDGAIWCWGRNSQGQTGSGAPDQQLLEPTRAPHPEGLAFTSLEAGLYHACAFDELAQLWCWGQSAGGRLGVELERARSPTPVELPSPITRMRADAFGACGLTEGHEAWCWGLNIDGSLGVGDRVGEVISPTPAPIDAVREVGLGRFHTCLLTQRGQLWCAGKNADGQLGRDPAEIDQADTWAPARAPWLQRR